MNSVTRIFLPLSILISGISFGGTFKFYFSQILIEIVKKQHILTLFYFFKFPHCLTLFPIFSLFIFCDCDRGIMLRLSRWMPMGTTIYADDLVIMDESLYGLLNQLTPVNIRVVCVRRE